MHFLEENDPILLAISEAELWENMDLLMVQIRGYDLLMTRALQNPDRRVSRMVVYLKSNLNYECLDDLESEEDAIIWLIVKRQRMRPLRISCIYREQTLCSDIQPNPTGRLAEQLIR